VSKNVAVFVDVANIFYAAKAAGVDIDYVTLLKSATAGRDFVRAYAYTGLDPDNENQRQFHAFLTRSGYKVVSKDIRKYGDGRIKANLDIELVVDMMRMAQHVDIAVVVSGDGDFAPAIRAVQQLGVRAEVISFRGNTSSDLIEVADVFTDITQIARVEKGARSGRRVAAEGDLSMTEVPEKETEGAVRRRRGRRSERVEARAEPSAPEGLEAPAEAAGMPGNLIILPGERLSRAAGEDAAEMPEVAVEHGAEPAVDAQGDGDAEGRRRRRRRGGRGRGRGRRPEGEFVGAQVEPGVEPEEEFLDEEIVPLPQHSTFGSVWDSQLGVTPPSLGPSSAGTPVMGPEDEDFEDEPEIPEYLLAERRNQQRVRGRPRPVGRRGSYQSAVDRERYGRGASAGATYPSAPRSDRPRSGLGGGRPNRPVQGRPVRAPFRPDDMRREPERPASSAEPWSEVPPEVQELLRAEMARRQATAHAVEVQRVEEPAEKVGGRRGRAPAARSAREAPVGSDTPDTGPAAPVVPAPRAARSRTAAPNRVAAPGPADAESPAPRRSRTRAATAATEAPAAADSAPPKPRRAPAKRTRSAAAAEKAGTAGAASSPDDATAAPRPAARRSRAKAPASAES
jgi:uncharacterized LabA/DUF88 family protein